MLSLAMESFFISSAAMAETEPIARKAASTVVVSLFIAESLGVVGGEWGRFAMNAAWRVASTWGGRPQLPPNQL
ncbi:hypothetical protein GCM10007320_32750 [Pseudorhodoferax aquiterrae]|uniref:Uncharacterized protein n=1 Tax=Pseudorhodoferax aquiterrae TaxID=747304 RepID=A0ABQ3G372_9BURK|nr:hypothetical protein GCM10007320_32750 [Pseudorhodoferax aquiterrae]